MGLSEPDESLILLDLDDNPAEQAKTAELAQLEPIQTLRTNLANLICKTVSLSVGDIDLAIVRAFSDLVHLGSSFDVLIDSTSIRSKDVMK